MDQLKDSTTAAGAGADQAKTKLQALFEHIDQKAAETFDNFEAKAKTVGVIAIAATGVLVGVALGAVAAAVYRIGVAAVEAAGFVAGLFTGESYKTEAISSLQAVNDQVTAVSQKLDITAASASALRLSLQRLEIPTGDYESVAKLSGGIEAAVRQTVDMYDALSDVDKAARGNQNELERLGFEYKDLNGNLLKTPELIQNVADRLSEFQKGYDRDQAAKAIGLTVEPKTVINAARVDTSSLEESRSTLAAYNLLIGTNTQEAVDRYEKAIREFNEGNDLTAASIKRVIADATIPTLTELAELLGTGFPDTVSVFREAMVGVIALFETFKLGAFAATEPVIALFEALGIGVAASMRAIDKALHFDFSGAKREVEEGAKAIEERFAAMSDNIKGAFAQFNKNVDLIRGKDSTEKATLTPTGDPDATEKFKPAPKGAGGAGTAANVDVAKKLLEQQLKALELFIGEEKNLLQGRDEFLSLYYQHSDITIRDYFEQRKLAQDDYVVSARKGYEEEIADLNAYIAKTKANGAITDDQKTARVTDAQTKLIEVRNKLRKVEQDANQETLKDWFANRTAVEQYQDGLKSLEAQIKGFSGDSAGAFSINFEQQNRDRLRQLNAVRNSDSSTKEERNAATQGIVDLDQIRQQGIATARLNDLMNDRSVILGDLANQQARIDLAVQRGTKSELQGLADTSAANQARVALLEQMVVAYDKVAEASNNLQDKVNADALHVELERLKTQTHLVADAFNDAAKDVTTNFFDILSDRTKTTHDKIKALLDDIGRRITKLGADAVGNVLFGKDGGLLKGLGDQVAAIFKPSAGSSDVSGAVASAGKSIFGTVGGSGSAANSDAFSSLTSVLTATTPVVSASFDTAAQSAIALSTALDLAASSAGGESASSSSSGIFASILGSESANGNVFAGGNVMAFAAGGIVTRPTIFPMARGGVGLMGEAGPEAIVPLRPTDRPYRDARGKLRVADGGGGQVVNNYTTMVNVPAPQSRDLSTARQHGEAIRRAIG